MSNTATIIVSPEAPLIWHPFVSEFANVTCSPKARLTAARFSAAQTAPRFPPPVGSGAVGTGTVVSGMPDGRVGVPVGPDEPAMVPVGTTADASTWAVPAIAWEQPASSAATVTAARADSAVRGPGGVIGRLTSVLIQSPRSLRKRSSRYRPRVYGARTGTVRPYPMVFRASAH